MSRAKALRAGDVGALADVDEQRVVADVERLEARQAQRGGAAGARRGATPRMASAMAWMCAGVVPQQPPAILMKPLRAQLAQLASPSTRASRRTRRTRLGRPALG